MRIASSLLLALLASSVVAVGCKDRSKTDTDGLGAEAAALVSDNDDADDAEAELEAGIEDPLSGAVSGGEVDLSAAGDGAAEKARTNAGVFFQPAGCIVSTRAANVVTHVFTNCTGPWGMTSFNGTVVSTWSKTATGLQVVHAADDFRINGATVDHTVTIAYSKTGGVYTRTRKGTSTGTTAAGKAITHTADYVTTYDSISRCIKRDGAGQTTIGGASFSRSIKGFERCGIGLGGCPKSGLITLSRPKLDVSLAFPGGPKVDITVNGKTYHRGLLCNASAT